MIKVIGHMKSKDSAPCACCNVPFDSLFVTNDGQSVCRKCAVTELGLSARAIRRSPSILPDLDEVPDNFRGLAIYDGVVMRVKGRHGYVEPAVTDPRAWEVCEDSLW